METPERVGSAVFPQKRTPSFQNDFIVISEFSEQEGPLPLFVIPEQGSEGTFDLNHFVLKIMAVDYQNKSSDPASYVRDSQVVMPEPKEDAVAYVHHFTLLDVYARGYVRPMCISYITHDRDKIMEFFEDFLEQFTNITRIFKEGNHRLFIRDLEYRMADARYTRQVLLQKGVGPSGISPNASMVTELLHDLEVMHKKFKRSLNNKLKSSLASSSSNVNTFRLDGDEEDHDDDDEAYYDKEEIHDYDGDHAISDVEDAYDAEVDEDEMKIEDMAIPGDLSIENLGLSPSMQRNLIDSNYKPKIIHSLHRTISEGKALRTLPELCDGLCEKAMSTLKGIYKSFSRPLPVLTLELADDAIMEPRCTLLTIGKTVVVNFNMDADRYASLLDMSLRSSPTQSVAQGGDEGSQSGSSGYASPYSSSISSSPVPEIDIDQHFYAQEVSKLHDRLSAGATDSQHVLVCPPSPREEINKAASGEILEQTPPKPADKPQKSPERPPHANSLHQPVNSFASSLWGLLPSVCGQGLLELRLKYSWMRHLIYSILKGRPVVVWGAATNETLVRSLVQALSIFVPGAGNVVHWQIKPLKMSDLAYLKLVGLSKQCPVPTAVEKYVTVLDVDNETLRSPAYNSSAVLVDNILSPKKTWPDEMTYLAHVHEVIYEIALKSCLYYHFCCVNISQMLPPSPFVKTPIKNGSWSQNARTPSDASSKTPHKRRSHSTTTPPQTVTNASSSFSASPVATAMATPLGTSLATPPTPTPALPTQEPGQPTPLRGLTKSMSNSFANSATSSTSSSSSSSGGKNKNSSASRYGTYSHGMRREMVTSPLLNPRSMSEPQINAVLVSVPPGVRDNTKANFFKQLEIPNGDSDIIMYLAEVVKEQQSTELQGSGAVSPVIRLDYSPCQLFRNTPSRK